MWTIRDTFLYLFILTRIPDFNVPKEYIIIFGYRIDKDDTFVNFLLIISSFSVYKIRIRCGETTTFPTTSLFFFMYVRNKKIYDTLKNAKKVPTVFLEHKRNGMNLRFTWIYMRPYFRVCHVWCNFYWLHVLDYYTFWNTEKW